MALHRSPVRSPSSIMLFEVFKVVSTVFCKLRLWLVLGLRLVLGLELGLGLG